jgi:hypothetical protein
MRKLIFLQLFFSLSLFGLSQRGPKRFANQDTLKAIAISRIPAVDISILKKGTYELKDGFKYQLYSLSVFNDTDSTICILFSDFQNESIKNRIFNLALVTDCNNDTISYYSLEHCEG